MDKKAIDKKEEIIYTRGRVARRGCPLQAPTEPDVPDYGIRLLGNRGSLRFERAVHNLDLGERIALQKTVKLLPSDLAPLRAPTQPFPPSTHYALAKLTQMPMIARLAVVSIVPPEFQHQFLVLPPDLGMPMLPAPGIDPLQGTAQPV